MGKKKGMDVSDLSGVNQIQRKQEEYNKLADAIRRHADIPQIYQILGMEKKEHM